MNEDRVLDVATPTACVIHQELPELTRLPAAEAVELLTERIVTAIRVYLETR